MSGSTDIRCSNGFCLCWKIKQEQLFHTWHLMPMMHRVGGHVFLLTNKVTIVPQILNRKTLHLFANSLPHLPQTCANSYLKNLAIDPVLWYCRSEHTSSFPLVDCLSRCLA